MNERVVDDKLEERREGDIENKEGQPEISRH